MLRQGSRWQPQQVKMSRGLPVLALKENGRGLIQLSKSKKQPAMLREAGQPPGIQARLSHQLTKVDVF